MNNTVIDLLIRRFSISYVPNRAVILIDIVGFSKLIPFLQTMQLNSLAHSNNSSHSKLMEVNLHVDFARSTTGDGFYLWNEDVSVDGNLNLYYLLKLILANNAIALQISGGNSTPRLKTAFHIGDYYKFYQVEALHPTEFNYIVGDVTIAKARLLSKAMPGQVLLGDFTTSGVNTQETGDENNISIDDSIAFIRKLINGLANLGEVELSDEKIKSIEFCLTGRKLDNNCFDISKYKIVDKYDLVRIAYNAKINIYLENGPPLFIGIQESDIQGIDKVEE